MNTLFKRIYLGAGILIIAFFAYSSFYGKAFWESKVVRNTEYNGHRTFYRYGNGLNHK